MANENRKGGTGPLNGQFSTGKKTDEYRKEERTPYLTYEHRKGEGPLNEQMSTGKELASDITDEYRKRAGP